MKKIVLIILPVLTIILAGCGLFDKKVKGSVFIVTKAGSSIKLGLTPVAALAKEEFERILSENIELINEFLVDYSTVYKEAEAEILSLIEKLDPIEKQYNSAKATLDSMIDSYESGGTRYRMHLSVSKFKREIKDYSTYKQNTAYAINAEKILNLQVSRINAIVEKYNEIWFNQFSGYKNTMNTIAQEAKDTISNCERSLAEQVHLTALMKTKTNADGECSLSFSKGVDYVVIAFADRSVGDITEEYNWFIPCSTTQGLEDDTLLISNHNLNHNLAYTAYELIRFNDFEYSPPIIPLNTEERFKMAE